MDQWKYKNPNETKMYRYDENQSLDDGDHDEDVLIEDCITFENRSTIDAGSGFA